MPGEDDAPAGSYWLVPVTRAVPAIGLAAVLTFVPDHSPAVGFVAFGLFAALSGAIIAVLSARTLPQGVTRSFFIVQGALSLLAGGIAITLRDGGLPFFLFLVSTFGAVTGFLELYSGLRARGRSVAGRDWLFVGALTALLAVVVLLVPPDFQQQFTGPDGIPRTLTASVMIVGALGAYAAILGVYLVIAGLSLKWARQDVRLETTEGGN